MDNLLPEKVASVEIPGNSVMVCAIVKDDRSTTKHFILKMHYICVSIFLYSTFKNQFCHTNSLR